jgi:hypothetical protein
MTLFLEFSTFSLEKLNFKKFWKGIYFSQKQKKSLKKVYFDIRIHFSCFGRKVRLNFQMRGGF